MMARHLVDCEHVRVGAVRIVDLVGVARRDEVMALSMPMPRRARPDGVRVVRAEYARADRERAVLLERRAFAKLDLSHGKPPALRRPLPDVDGQMERDVVCPPQCCSRCPSHLHRRSRRSRRTCGSLCPDRSMPSPLLRASRRASSRVAARASSRQNASRELRPRASQHRGGVLRPCRKVQAVHRVTRSSIVLPMPPSRWNPLNLAIAASCGVEC